MWGEILAPLHAVVVWPLTLDIRILPHYFAFTVMGESLFPSNLINVQAEILSTVNTLNPSAAQ